MRYSIVYIFALVLLFMTSCKKDTSNPSEGELNKPAQPTVLVNHLTCSIGTISYSTQNFGVQPLINTYLYCISYRDSIHLPSDTISVNFTLKLNNIGTYILDSTTIGENNRFVVALNIDGNPSQRTYFSKSGIVNITTFDIANWTYAGTFSGVIESESNPNDTLLLSNGSFYFKYF